MLKYTREFSDIMREYKLENDVFLKHKKIYEMYQYLDINIGFLLKRENHNKLANFKRTILNKGYEFIVSLQLLIKNETNIEKHDFYKKLYNCIENVSFKIKNDYYQEYDILVLSPLNVSNLLSLDPKIDFNEYY